jgi:hypothetical protein
MRLLSHRNNFLIIAAVTNVEDCLQFPAAIVTAEVLAAVLINVGEAAVLLGALG